MPAGNHTPPTPSPLKLRELPERPDLQQLKTQAKELLKRYQSGDEDAVLTVRRFFSPQPGQALTLGQAQLVLARCYGYESWPKLKAFVDGVTRERLVEAVNAGDTALVRSLLKRRPEMAGATTGRGEQQLIHLAVVHDDEPMVRLLVELGADPRRGIWPHRESTTAHTMARERGLDHLVRAIEQVEADRRESMSCPNVTVSDEQEQLAGLIRSGGVGRNDEAIAMLEADPELIRQCDREGATPLHIAAAHANAEMVDWLCDHRADARKNDIQGRTPIDHAVLSVGWRTRETVAIATRIMHRLKRRGCETTPIAAAAMGDLDVLRRIPPQRIPRLTIEGGGVSGNRGALLTRAVQFDQYDAVKCLLDMGLDPNEPTPLGKASDDPNAVSWGGPIWNAAAFGRHKIARLLLDGGADPNGNVYASGWPLDRAYERGDQKMIDLLYDRGAQPTPWTIGSQGDVERALRLVRDDDDPDRIRELVWAGACAGQPSIVETVLPHMTVKLDESQTHDMLCQPMRLNTGDEAAAERHLECMRLLLATDLDVNAKGRFGLTLLHFVAARQMPGSARRRFATMLLDAGADPAARDELLRSSALGWAARYGRLGLVELLLDRGATVDEPDAPAWATPRQWAAKLGHANIEKLLLGK